MALSLITGIKGSGKTSFAVSKLVEAARQGREIFANFRLKFPPMYPTRYLDMEAFAEEMVTLRKVAVCIDEAQIYFDCRMSGSKRNRLFSYVMLQSRKREVDFLLTSQQERNVDIRIRRNLDYRYDCTALVAVPGRPGRYRVATVEQIEAKAIDRIQVVETNYAQNRVRRILFDPTPYFALYDSDELCSIA